VSEGGRREEAEWEERGGEDRLEHITQAHTRERHRRVLEYEQ
jgi:hypothetical protein